MSAGPFTVSANHWALAKVTCPGQKVPVSGGVYSPNPQAFFNIGSSYPSTSSRSWIVVVNDPGTTSSTSFYVDAVCLAPGYGYTVVTSPVATGGPEQNSETFAFCPAKTISIGGGVQSNIDVWFGMNMSALYRNGGPWGWEIGMSNPTANTYDFTAYVVCRSKPLGWTSTGGTGSVPSGGVTTLTSPCPGNTVAIGGGGYLYPSTPSGLAGIVIRQTFFYGTGWRTQFFNGSNGKILIGLTVICAGT